jgi:hypothetical protein
MMDNEASKGSRKEKGKNGSYYTGQTRAPAVDLLLTEF